MSAQAFSAIPLPPLPAIDLPDTAPSPADQLFGMPGLPEAFREFRDSQWDAIVRIHQAFADGARVVMVDAPTGSGKTLLGEVTRRLLRARAVFVCVTRSLQDQVQRDFRYAEVLKGRANYPTRNFPANFPQLSCADCSASPGSPGCPLCTTRDQCPYGRQKLRAILAPLLVTNTAFYAGEINGPGALKGRNLVIVDEADTLEGVLMGQVEVAISARRQRTLGLAPPARKTVESAWLEWVEQEAIPKVSAGVGRIPEQTTRPTELRERTQLLRLLGRLRRLGRELAEGANRWVYDGRSEIIFRPVRIDRVAPWLMWQHAPRHLLMSATLIEPGQMARDLGIPDGQWASVRMGSTFPAERRRVHVCPVANMSHKTAEEAWPRVARACVVIARRHPDERILIHSVSYALTARITNELRRAGMGMRTITYTRAADRDRALADYLALPAAVLVAPSLDRGIDLPEDACRVQVVAKCPFASLGDKQVAARLYGTGLEGELWYRINAIRTLVQMTGRGMRSADDRVVTYLLDKQFLDTLWRRSKRLMPAWWRDALDFNGQVVRELTREVA